MPWDSPGVQHYSGFRPERLARLLDFQEIHFHPPATGFYDYLRHADLQSTMQNTAAAPSVRLSAAIRALMTA